MKLEIEIPKYNKFEGIKIVWEDNFSISVTKSENDICISANSAGLISLAKHCLTLAQESVPAGSHIHYDDYNSLEEGSDEIIICKVANSV